MLRSRIKPQNSQRLRLTADQVDIVRATRQLVLSGLPWSDIEQQIIKQFLTPGGNIYDQDESIMFANRLLRSITSGSYRAYLPYGLAVMFHEAPPWNGFPDRIQRWGGR